MPPTLGSIVFCFFPFKGTAPEKIARPVLVVGRNTDKNDFVWLDIVPGTGQKADSVVNSRGKSKWDIEEPEDPSGINGSNLKIATVFQFDCATRLPYEQKWFPNKDSKRGDEIFGKAHVVTKEFWPPFKIHRDLQTQPSAATSSSLDTPVVTIKRKRKLEIPGSKSPPQAGTTPQE